MGADRLLESFLDLVRIDSPAGSEAALAAHCAHLLESLGCEVRFDDTTAVTGSDTGNLIAELAGTAPGAPTLLLSAHLDCVEPCRGVEPVVRDGVVRSAGDTVLGADDKAGIAAIIEAMRRVVEAGSPRGNLRVVLTVAEECGLKGAKALDPADARADVCLVLDADGDPGGIVTAAPTHLIFVAEFSGTAAHAGVAPEEGRSALVMASRAVCSMRLGRLDDQTTANAGTLSGGTAVNVVPAFATLAGECRALDATRVEETRAAMDAVMRESADAEGGSVEIRWSREYESYRVPDGSPLIETVRAACADVGLAPRLFATGGGSDGSVFAAHGTPTLVLSSGMRSAHSVDEHITVSDLEALAELVRAAIVRFGLVAAS
ncbi:MAG TPA: M20/M25/M40 family metallo-hydrolase [Coriobacteriia bacterium]|nr:M20/M25/M40 family metallo-hydrolase [Coriobacteriia bacterium]